MHRSIDVHGGAVAVAGLGLSLACARRARNRLRCRRRKPTQAKTQASQQLTQPLNNQPVWKEIRSGEPQYTSLPGRETNVLIQPQGQTWRAARVPARDRRRLPGRVGRCSCLAASTCGADRSRVHGAPTGRLIERFTLVERAVHWTVAITFATLAITGLILTFGKTVLLPLIGYTLFSWLAILAKNLHNFVGADPGRRAADHDRAVRAREHFRAYDWTWLKKGGGMLTGRARAVGQGQRRPEGPVLG